MNEFVSGHVDTSLIRSIKNCKKYSHLLFKTTEIFWKTNTNRSYVKYTRRFLFIKHVFFLHYLFTVDIPLWKSLECRVIICRRSCYFWVVGEICRIPEWKQTNKQFLGQYWQMRYRRILKHLNNPSVWVTHCARSVSPTVSWE